MKRYISTFILVVAALFSAQGQNSCKVLQSDYTQLHLQISTPNLLVGQTDLFGESYNTLSMDDFIEMGNAGKPNLPVMSKMIEVPLCSGFEVVVNAAVFDTLDAEALGIKNCIVPAQPSRSKSDRTPAQFVIDQSCYEKDAFFGADEILSVTKIGVARNRNLATLAFAPVRYNPVSGKLIVCRSIDATIVYSNADVQATQEMQAKHFSGAYSTGVSTLNTLKNETKEMATAENGPIHYLIVAHSSFRGMLDNFVAWKQRKGFLVTVGYTDDANVGTTTNSIAQYIKGFYTNAMPSLPAPTYLLLVGDVAQIPAFSGRYSYTGPTSNSGHVTDLYYTTWTDDDLIPDCYYGRFSATNEGQLVPQIEKTLMYEQYGFEDPSFLSRAILISGVDGGYSSDNAYRYADPTMDYVAKTYVTSDNGFSSITYYKNNTAFAPTGVTVTGSSQSSTSAAALRTLYSNGAGWINYSAHGSYDSWAEPSFSVSQVNGMTNTQKFGVMIGNCCLTNKFDENTCFGEALLRKGNYCGAVAYFGGSNSTYWAEDFYWSVGVRSSISNTMNTNYSASNLGMYDRLFHTHNEARSDWYTTTGSMMMAGNMSVQNSSTRGKNYYWEIYHIMGDPSVTPWLSLASTMTVQCSPSPLPVGSTSLDVNAVPYAYVALTDGNGTLIAADFADAVGAATLVFEPYASTDSVELAVSAQGYQTYFQKIALVQVSGPFVVSNSVTTDVAAVAGTTVPLSITMVNVGAQNTSSLSVEFSSPDGLVTFSNNGTIALSNLNAGTSTTVSAVVNASFSASLKDQQLVPVVATLRWGSQSDQQSQRTYLLTVNAPKFSLENTNFAQTPQPGTSVQLNVTLRNVGHAALGRSAISLVSLEPLVSVTGPSDSLARVDADETLSSTFSLSISSELPENVEIPFFLYLTSSGFVFKDTIMMTVGTGQKETFETGDFSMFEWTQGNYPWQVVNSGAHSGTYCARSYSFGNNGARRSSQMTISYTSTADDSVSFFYKVSSEDNYDKFFFYLDNAQMLEVSGEEDWSRASFPVRAGTHTYKFSYEKDYSNDNGSDCAWIDDVRFPINGTQRHYEALTVARGTTVTFHNLVINTQDSAYGTYYYRDETTSGHVYTLMLTVTDGSHVAIEEVKEDVLRVYPNPASDLLMVEIDKAGADVELYDTRGQLVLRQSAVEGKNTLPISHLASGIYVLRCGEKVAKIVKQ